MCMFGSCLLLGTCSVDLGSVDTSARCQACISQMSTNTQLIYPPTVSQVSIEYWLSISWVSVDKVSADVSNECQSILPKYSKHDPNVSQLIS